MPLGHLVLGATKVMRQDQRMLSLLQRTSDMPQHVPDEKTGPQEESGVSGFMSGRPRKNIQMTFSPVKCKFLAGGKRMLKILQK